MARKCSSASCKQHRGLLLHTYRKADELLLIRAGLPAVDLCTATLLSSSFASLWLENVHPLTCAGDNNVIASWMLLHRHNNNKQQSTACEHTPPLPSCHHWPGPSAASSMRLLCPHPYTHDTTPHLQEIRDVIHLSMHYQPAGLHTDIHTHRATEGWGQLLRLLLQERGRAVESCTCAAARQTLSSECFLHSSRVKVFAAAAMLLCCVCGERAATAPGPVCLRGSSGLYHNTNV